MNWPQWIKTRLWKEWQHLFGAYDRWVRDDGWLMAAAVAYYVGLSFFPLVLVLISAFGLFLRFTQQGQDAKAAMLDLMALHLSPGLENNVGEALALVQENAMFNGPIALVGIVIAALAGFAQFERAFDRIWGVTQVYRKGILGAIIDVLIRRGVAFLLLLCFGLLIVTIFIAGLVLSGIEYYTDAVIDAPDALWKLIRTGLTLMINTVMFVALYRWLSKVKVRWREALRGGVVAAVFWEIGRQALTMFLVKTGYGSAYGVIGSFIAIQLWCYYAVSVIFFGAEYIQEFCHACDEPTRGPYRVGAAADVEPTPVSSK